MAMRRGAAATSAAAPAKRSTGWWIIDHILQDWGVNGSAKARLILVLFRLGQLFKQLPHPVRLLGVPYLAFYRVLVEWVLGVELPCGLQVGPNLWLGHGHALVIDPDTRIGANCFLRQSTTIGRKGWRTAEADGPGAPRIGDNVNIGANVVILGPIAIGDGAVIGAGSVVVKDVPAGAVVAGNPARVLRVGAEEPGIRPDLA